MERDATTRRSFLAAAAGTATVAAGCLGTRDQDGSDPYATPAAEAFDGVVDGEWLAERLEDVALLDVRDEGDVTDSRIEGAHRLSETIHDHYEETEDGPDASPDAVAAVLEEAGIERDDDVVVYGEETTMWATHGVYTLSAIGHEGDVFLLDGGVSAWEESGGATESGELEPADEPTGYAAELDTTVLATREYVAENVSEDGADVTIVDNRTPEEYRGEDDDDRVSRHGHVPGAINVNFPQNFEDGDAGARFRSPADLEELWLSDADLDPDEPAITYCTTGVRGSVGWFVLTQLGFDDVRNYDGSWLDWGTLSEDDGYYYETGDGTVIDAFA